MSNKRRTVHFDIGKDDMKIARVGLHNYEEPIISGKNGSGTIFFSGCNLKCVFCQNYEISHGKKGIDVSIDTLKDLMLYLQHIGAENINLVTPSLYVKSIASALERAKIDGLNIPVVYNTSSYETVETLKILDCLVDVYLPDFKYSDDDLAMRLSNAKNYSAVAFDAISEMKRQQPKDVFDGDMIKKGVVVRHLVLPDEYSNTVGVFKKIAQIDKDMLVSVMAQYFPTAAVSGTKYDRRLTDAEYDAAVDAFFEAGLSKGFSQDLESGIEDYVPSFDLDELAKILNDLPQLLKN